MAPLLLGPCDTLLPQGPVGSEALPPKKADSWVEVGVGWGGGQFYVNSFPKTIMWVSWVKLGSSGLVAAPSPTEPFHQPHLRF